MDKIRTEDISVMEDAAIFRFVEEARVVQLRRGYSQEDEEDEEVQWMYCRRLELAGRTSVERAQGGFMDGVKEDRKSIEAGDWLQPLLREQP